MKSSRHSACLRRWVKLPNKEIDFVGDMKITFVHDKVANVE